MSRWVRFVVLVAGLAGLLHGFGAQLIWPEDETPEQRYWRTRHAKEAEQQKLEEQRLKEIQAQVEASVKTMVEAGQAYQSAVIETQDGPPPPPAPPSFIEQHQQYFVFGGIFTMIAILVSCTLVRHKREAEIRALSGVYLSDGTEISRFKMPALFELPQTIAEPVVADAAQDDGAAERAKEQQLDQFFAFAREQVADMRQALPEVSRAFDDDERQETLRTLCELVSSVNQKADCWELRPVWQLTSALGLLLNRLVEKSKETTPSTIRTMAAAVDLLAELCVPGVRPDLIINPPISVLAVDDDPLCLRAVVYALQKAEMTPDTAQNGELAVALAKEKSYDVVFMDILMPVMDGLKACSELHATPRNRTTPVVFVTARTDFRARTESTLVGGVDLMAKPFLMFEITVKALTFAMRKRLDLMESCRRDLAALGALTRAEGKPAAEPVAA